MFISERYKLIFLEVPRTGSRSVTKALVQLDPESPTHRLRQLRGNYYNYHNNNLTGYVDDDYRIIAGHRNPFDRVWSYWKHRRTSGNPKILKSIEWPRYVDWVYDPASVPEIKKANMDIPITEMFDPEIIDYWLCFESLDRSWWECAQTLNFPYIALKKVNRSPEIGEFKHAYTADTAKKVLNRFQSDFEYFGYSTEI